MNFICGFNFVTCPFAAQAKKARWDAITGPWLVIIVGVLSIIEAGLSEWHRPRVVLGNGSQLQRGAGLRIHRAAGHRDRNELV